MKGLCDAASCSRLKASSKQVLSIQDVETDTSGWGESRDEDAMVDILETKVSNKGLMITIE